MEAVTVLPVSGFFAVAVITVVPTDFASMLPASSTVATEGLEELNVAVGAVTVPG